MSYEKGINSKIKNDEDLPEKLDISVLKYFWLASPLSRAHQSAIPKFLRSIKVFKNFSDNELRALSKYLHVRHFSSKEAIFKQDDNGVGFYLIYNGQVDIMAKSYKISKDDEVIETEEKKEAAAQAQLFHITTLEKGDHFGELALLQENALRTASAIAKESCCLLGIFKPDVNELINDYPVVGAKLLQSISIILANRLSSITTEMKVLKYKLNQQDLNEYQSQYRK